MEEESQSEYDDEKYTITIRDETLARIALVIFGVLVLPLVWLGYILITLNLVWVLIVGSFLAFWFLVYAVLDYYVRSRTTSKAKRFMVRFLPALPLTLSPIITYFFARRGWPWQEMWIPGVTSSIFVFLMIIESVLLCGLLLAARLERRYPPLEPEKGGKSS